MPYREVHSSAITPSSPDFSTVTPCDDALVAQSNQGDAQAFRELIERHYDSIYRIAYHWSGNPNDADDITQNVCMKLSNILPSFDGRSQFTSWLYRVTINQAKDFYRATSRHQGQSLDDSPAVPTLSLDATQEDAILAQQVWVQIARLPAPLKSAVILVLVQGLSHKQAADILQCREGTISWRLHRAKKLLRSALSSNLISTQTGDQNDR